MKPRNANPAPRPQRVRSLLAGGPRWRRWLLRASAAMVVYTLAGFFGIPALLKWQLNKQLPTAAHRPARVQEVKFNPYTLALTVNGLSIKETNGAPFASFAQLHVNFQVSSLFRRAWTFRQIRLVEPQLYSELRPDGRFNFADLLVNTNAAPKPTNDVPAGLPRVIVFDLFITNGQLAMADLTLKTPFRTTYEPINLSLRDFTTKPDDDSAYSFEAEGDSGRRLAWKGTVTATPAASAGALKVAGVQLPRFAPYSEASTRAKLTGGTLDLEANYDFSAGTNGIDLVVSNLIVAVSGLEVKDPETSEVVLGLPKYEMRGGRFDWRKRTVHLDEVSLEEPTTVVRRRADGSFNLMALMNSSNADGENRNKQGAKPEKKKTGTNEQSTVEAPWVFSLNLLRLERGAVSIEDLTTADPVRTRLSPISLKVEHFSTATDSNAQLSATLATELKETIELTANACLTPLRAEGLLHVSMVDLPKYFPYASPFLAGRIEQGKLDITLPFSHQTAPGGEFRVWVTNGTVHLRDFDVLSPDGKEKWAQVPSLDLDGIDVDLAAQTVSVRAIGSTNAQLQVRREADGKLNLLSLLRGENRGKEKVESRRQNVEMAKEKESGESSGSTNLNGWSASVGELALANWAVQFEDRTLAKPAAVTLDQIGLSLRGAQFPGNAPVDTVFSARLNRGGTVATRGTVFPYSGAVETEVTATSLDLRGVQPWLDPHVRLTLSNAWLSTAGRLTLAASTGSPGGPGRAGPRIRWTGDAALTNLVTTDQVLQSELARWNVLEVTGADVQLEPNQISIERVRLDGLRTGLVIGPDKQPNFATILPRKTNVKASASMTNAPRGDSEAVPASLKSAPATNAMPIRIAEVQINSGSFHFHDQSIQPAAIFDLKQFGGTVRGLSTVPGSTADLDVSGRIDDSAPFAVKGTINPLSKDLWLDIVITNQNLQLTPFTPYMEKYAGHPLNKGRLSLDLGYAIKEGKLKAHNVIRIDQLTLGQRNESPDATKLPVKLGVALLKDANGRIELDVPLQGDLNDPEFRVAPLVLKVVMNLIAKAAASPFKLLGGLVGGGEELSFVEFEPGLAQFRAGESNKLAKLVKALQQRPALNLEIEGGVDAVADHDALAHAMVRSDAQRLLREERTAAGETNEVSQAEVDTEFDRLLRVLASRQFGTNLAEALQQVETNAPSTNFVARTPKPAPKLVTYVTGIFASKAERNRLAEARKQAREDALLFEQNPVLATVKNESLEDLLASKAVVPADALRELRLERARVVQQALMEAGGISANRLFLTEPKADAIGAARVTLNVN